MLGIIVTFISTLHCLRTIQSSLLSAFYVYVMTKTILNIHHSLSLSALRQVRSFFQREFSTECDIVLPLSIPSILSFT